MLKIGLTGGMGSGKTTVAHIFEVLGIPVYYADEAAKGLMNEDPALRQQIEKLFGPGVYKEGKLDRHLLGSLVFSDIEKLRQLNDIVHPATRKDGVRWMSLQKAPYAIKEAALIFEAGIQSDFDYVIGVTAPESLRISRVIKRDGSSREKVLERIRQQMNEEEKMKRCDFVIANDEKEAVLPQAIRLHEHLLAETNRG
jgi:dephospho-CoA kinase